MRRLTVECESCGKQTEIVIGINEAIKSCQREVLREKLTGIAKQKCMGSQVIVWAGKSPGFRVKGLTKRF